MELIQSSSSDVLASAGTLANGGYRLTLIPELDAVAFDSSGLALRAVDRNRRVLAEQGDLTLRPGDTVTLDLDVPTTLLEGFEPVATPLEPFSGPLVERTVLATVEAAVAGLALADDSLRDDYLKTAERAIPRLAALRTFPANARGALDGDFDAEERFLRTLARHGHDSLESQGSRPRAQTAFGLSSDLRARSRSTTLPPPHRRRCALSLDRFALIAAAALATSDSEEDAFWRLAQLEHGLAGLGELEELLDGAAQALEGDPSRLLDSLEALSNGPRLGDRSPDLRPFPPPNPRPGFVPVGVCERVRRECVRGLVEKLKRPWLATGPQTPFPTSPGYTISSLTPTDACPGTTVVISGTGFGSIPGEVCFPTGASGRTRVGAATWNDSEVTAVVPPDAGSGTLTLKILEYTIIACDSTIDVYRRGKGAAFRGGAGKVMSLSVDGRSERVCVPPSEPVMVAWGASPVGNVQVELRVQYGASMLVNQSGLPAEGSLVFTTPPVTEPTAVDVTVTAKNACGSDSESLVVHIDVVPTIVVEGMEVTQGIQTFWRAGVADNSLPVIAGKDTIVRVYISADRQGFNADRVKGPYVTLDVGGVRLLPINGYTPDKPGGSQPLLSIGRRADIVRGTTDHTFNFRIPAYLCNGSKSLFAYVVAGVCGGHRTVTASRLQTVSWQNEPPLRVRFVRVRDDRPAPNGTGTRPSEDEARFTVLRAFDLLPTPTTDIAPAITATWDTTHDFTALEGLRALLTDIDRSHDTWEWIFSFLELSGPPAQDAALWIALTSPFNRGLADRPGNTSVAAIWTVAQGRTDIRRVTPAHEIAHNLDFMHVNRECPGQTIEGLFYAHPNNGDLQDVPFDPYWNQAIAGSIQDFMSYGCTVWTSDDSWTRLQGAI